MILLPIVTMLLTYWASVGYVNFEKNFDTTSSCQSGIQSVLGTVANSEVMCPSCNDLWDLATCAIVICFWFLFQVLLERFLPCDLVQGAPLPDGSGNRLSYRINGHLAFWVTLLVANIAWPSWVEISEGGETKSVLVFGRAPITWLYDNYSTLAFVTILWTFVLSTYLYFRSFGKGLLLAVGGNSGNPFYDYFMGRELNPRWGSFDWKEF
ncbi:hypothetical protein ACHAXS_003024, partial [Conticribra weissflogii]